MTIRCVPPCIRLVVWAAVGTASALPAAEPTGDGVLFDMDTVRHKINEITTKDKQKMPAGSVELVKGKFGKACKFSFVEGARGGFATGWIHADPSGWDRAAGISFWVKGDGSQNWGGLEMIDGNNYRLRYGYCFPVDSTEWTKVTVPWSDLIPELAGPLVGADGGYAPSGFRNLWFGKWHYWRDYPAHSFAIDQVQIEQQIDIDMTDYAPDDPGIARVLAKLKAGQPVTIVTMGDSLSDKRHWANRDKLWSELLCEQLGAKYGAKITLVNPAIGGTSLNQNLVTMPRWLKTTPRPDLVTVCFGYNDFDNGVRGPRFAEYLRFGIDRIRRMTGGRADVLLITTCPAHVRWTSMSEMARAVHDMAKEKKTGFADIATAFHKTGSPQAALAQGYWAWDKTHLGNRGHEVVAETVFRAIQSDGLADFDKAEETLWWHTDSGGETSGPGGGVLSSFEPGMPDLVSRGGSQIVRQHATDGSHALRMVSQKNGYTVIAVEGGPGLRRVRAHRRLLVDLYNPQPRDVTIGITFRDSRSVDFDSRYNGERVLKPGANQLDLDYTNLPRWGTRIAEQPQAVALDDITLVVLLLLPHGDGAPATLYVDNMRVAR